MIVKIPNVLSPEEVQYCREVLHASEWVDGKASAGEQARDVKANLQIEIGSEPFRELGERVLRALGRNSLFNSLTIPLRVRSPMFNRYDAGMHYGPHIDGAIHSVPGAPRMRADLSSTLFLADPHEYDGGELVMHRLHSTEVYKLNAGDVLVYPTDVIHSVSPVTRGTRWAAFFWTQSIVKSHEQRAILHEMDRAIMEIRKLLPDTHPAVLALTSSYHNQLRLSSEI